MKVPSLHNLLILELQDLYSAEKQLVEALPKMVKAATTQDLKESFQDHLEQTEGHVARLEAIAEDLDFKIQGEKCKGMEGLIKEGDEMMKMDQSSIRDLALIGAAQRVEHYEISGYGTARTLAEAMEHDNVADLLQETLDEEESADQILSSIAESIIEELNE
jgi:ferritin-like metal-binding protein YciE